MAGRQTATWCATPAPPPSWRWTGATGSAWWTSSARRCCGLSPNFPRASWIPGRIRRELSEETGFACGHLEHLATLASTPGFTDELLHIYLATELVAGQAHADEDEFLACRFVPLDELLEAISRGELTDMKTVAGLLLAARRVGERK